MGRLYYRKCDTIGKREAGKGEEGEMEKDPIRSLPLAEPGCATGNIPRRVSTSVITRRRQSIEKICRDFQSLQRILKICRDLTDLEPSPTPCDQVLHILVKITPRKINIVVT